VEAHQSFRLAEDRVAMLSSAEPDLLFYLAPIAVDGVIFYRVLAGPAADRESAARIMERLVEARHKTQMQDWDIRPTAWAYMIGEYPDRGVAEAMQLELREDGVPSYVVEVPFTEGPSRFRIYAGAYSSRAEAGIMERMLEEAGIRAEFRRRAGRPAS
jgi:cell division septation protein DedD